MRRRLNMLQQPNLRLENQRTLIALDDPRAMERREFCVSLQILHGIERRIAARFAACVWFGR